VNGTIGVVDPDRLDLFKDFLVNMKECERREADLQARHNKADDYEEVSALHEPQIPKPWFLHPDLWTLNPQPKTLNPAILNPESWILNRSLWRKWTITGSAPPEIAHLSASRMMMMMMVVVVMVI
jgi:hypothetical protein